MAERAAPNAWVEIATVVLAPGERAPGVPDDTSRVALEMRVKGYLVAATQMSQPAEIVTVSGRRLRGRLVAINPAYTHGFGAPIPELLEIGTEVRRVLVARDGASGASR